jgi:hypothetical protein
VLKLRLRGELADVVNAERLLEISHLGHGVLETAVAEQLMLLFHLAVYGQDESAAAAVAAMLA